VSFSEFIKVPGRSLMAEDGLNRLQYTDSFPTVNLGENQGSYTAAVSKLTVTVAVFSSGLRN
jgi:hypothetical protein